VAAAADGVAQRFDGVARQLDALFFCELEDGR
jgi:hypothetical protein